MTIATDGTPEGRDMDPGGPVSASTQPSDRPLRGTALVAGAGRNIGRAIAIAFAEAGADVAVNVATNRSEGEAVAREVAAMGVRSHVVVGDVSDPDIDASLIADVEQALGRVSYLVNCVAPRPRQGIDSTTPADWDQVVSTILSSTFYLSRLVLPGMASQGFGRIISLGGSVASTAFPNRPHVVAAKHGLVGLMKAIAVEYGDRGITANLISPGMTDTTRNPADYPGWPPSDDELKSRLCVPRLGQPWEIARACLFVASPDAGYITAQHLHVDGGMVL